METGKGLRQGDPLSPILFNLVANVFSKMLDRAANNNLISGLLTNLRPGGVISLQYADDTLIFLENNLEKAQHLKWILALFEQISGMRINFDKSDMIPINLEEADSSRINQVFGCKTSQLPMKYLGVPLHHNKLTKEALQLVVDKVIKRVAGWRGRLLSYGGRLVLIRACLASIPIYLLSVIKFPAWAIHAIESQMAHCLWDNYDGHKKYHLANWELVSMKKQYGGLGIPNLRDLNLALLASWIKIYHLGGQKLWKHIIDTKYDGLQPNLFAKTPNDASPFWKGIMWTAHAAKQGYTWVVGNGKSIRFWEDMWFGSSNLAIQYWDIYYVCNEKNVHC